MNRSIRLIVSFVALLAFSAEAADVSGSWSAKIVTAAGQRDYTFVLRQNEGKLIGTIKSPDGIAAISNGYINAKTITFTENVTVQGRRAVFDYTGELVSDNEIRFKREAGPEIRRLFAGPLVPAALLKPGRLPVLPLPDRLVLQCVHGDDVAEAYRLAATSAHARGAYNVAAEPVLDPAALARTMGARRMRIPERPLRLLADLTWRARLQPAPAGWVDMGLAVPVMDIRRAREELGWRPRNTAEQALHELLAGMREPAGLDTPPLEPRAGGVLRAREFLTGLGGRL